MFLKLRGNHLCLILNIVKLLCFIYLRKRFATISLGLVEETPTVSCRQESLNGSNKGNRFVKLLVICS